MTSHYIDDTITLELRFLRTKLRFSKILPEMQQAGRFKSPNAQNQIMKLNIWV